MREADTAALLAQAAALKAEREKFEPPNYEVPKTKTESWVDPNLPELTEDFRTEAEAVISYPPATTDADVYMRQILDDLPIEKAYDIFCGKKKGMLSGRELMVSCPTPEHPDNHPSASMNIQDRTWICYGCDARGDVIDLIGINLGLNPKTEYIELSKRACKKLGYDFWIDSRGWETIVLPGTTNQTNKKEPDPEPEPEPTTLFDEPEPAKTAPKEPEKDIPEDLGFDDTWAEMDDAGKKITAGESRKTTILNKAGTKIGVEKAPKKATEPPKNTPKPPKTDENELKKAKERLLGRKIPSQAEKQSKRAIETDDSDDYDPDYSIPSLDWRSIIPENTFIHEYCTIACARKDCAPEEFHFWNAVSLVGMALRRDVCLLDVRPVYGNFYICDVAKSGDRKGMSASFMVEVLTKAFQYNPETGSGVDRITTSLSGEALVDSFVGECNDPRSTPHNPLPPIKFPKAGLIQINELSSLTAVTGRQGNILEPIMIDLYDCAPDISVRSRSSGGKVIAKEPFGSLLTAVQPKVVQSVITQRMLRSGFANRFIWVLGPTRGDGTLGDFTVFEASQTDIVKQLQDIRQEMCRIVTRSDGIRIVEFDPAAKDMFNHFQIDEMNKLKTGTDSDLVVRMDLHMRKLVLAFTANMNLHTVTPEAVKQAIAVWPYMVDCNQYVGMKINSTEGRENESRVLQVIAMFMKKNAGKGPTFAEIWKNGIDHYQPIVDRESLRKIIASLKSSYVIKEIEPTAGMRGRPQPRYIIPD